MSMDPKQTLLSIVRSFGDMGIYAKEVNGDNVIKYNEDEQFFTCSCYKVITAIALYHKLEQEGNDDSLVLPYTAEHRVAGSGSLKMMQSHSNSIYNFLVMMLKQSDNTATHLLEEYVTREQQDMVVQSLGLGDTEIRLDIRELVNYEMGLPREATPEQWDAKCIARNAVSIPFAATIDISRSNVSTPFNLCRVLEELVNPTLISADNSQKIIDILKQYDSDDRIVEFGKYIEIANKGGWAVGLRSDMNIVFAENPFYLVLMAKNLTNPERNRLVSSYNEIVNLTTECFRL